ncbi:MAG: tRNA-specific adenosine-34 deaminase, partial [uncultured Acidimicrobiales bacterium]
DERRGPHGPGPRGGARRPRPRRRAHRGGHGRCRRGGRRPAPQRTRAAGRPHRPRRGARAAGRGSAAGRVAPRGPDPGGDARALPHVRRRLGGRAGRPPRLRSDGSQGRGVRLVDEPVCRPPAQPPGAGDRWRARRGVWRPAPGLLPGTSGTVRYHL